MKILHAALFSLLILSAEAQAEDKVAPPGPPAWFLEEIATLTAGTGRWIASNAAYQSDDEPFEAYGIEWKSGFGGTTMSGRLFGLKDGIETVDFWHFRQYWHPGRQTAVLEQFGWGGRVGVGDMWQEDKLTKTDQTFFSADGSTMRDGHISHFVDAFTHQTDSYNINGDDWVAHRQYTWRLAPEQEQKSVAD